jgi:hypothetical protein
MEDPLKQAFQYRGCPICLVLDKDEYNFMCHWQHQTFKEEKARQDLVSANGYCNFHFYEMARLTSPLVNAVVVKDLIDKEIQEIEKGAFQSLGKIDCPVCAYLGQREEFYLQEFKRLLPERFMQEKYERTDGLCRIHLEKVFPLLGKNGPEHFLIHAQEKQLKNLRQELQDFISKGGRSSKEIRKEKNSWWIAIKKRVGKKGLKESIFS